VTPRETSQRICSDDNRGCCEASPPRAGLGVAFPSINPNEDAMAKKAKKAAKKKAKKAKKAKKK
jgi:hypothetical protein